MKKNLLLLVLISTAASSVGCSSMTQVSDHRELASAGDSTEEGPTAGMPRKEDDHGPVGLPIPGVVRPPHVGLPIPGVIRPPQDGPVYSCKSVGVHPDAGLFLSIDEKKKKLTATLSRGTIAGQMEVGKLTVVREIRRPRESGPIIAYVGSYRKKSIVIEIDAMSQNASEEKGFASKLKAEFGKAGRFKEEMVCFPRHHQAE